jgi:hypothetical protein
MGLILAHAEKWPGHKGSDFVLFMSGFQANPIGNESINSDEGKVVGCILAAYSFVLINAILGLSGILDVVNLVVTAEDAGSTRYGSMFFFGGVLLLVSPVMIFVFSLFMCGLDFLLNPAHFGDSFMGQVDWITTGGSLGILKPPDEDLRSIVIRMLVAMWSISFSGMLLGFIGAT